MFRFSISNAFRRKWVLIIAILGTALGCALMTVLLSVSDGMNQMVTQTMSRVAGDITVVHRNMPPISPLGATSSDYPLPASYIAEIEGIEHVESVAPAVTVYIPGENVLVEELTELPGGWGLTFNGIDVEQDWALDGAVITKGHGIEGDNQVIMGDDLYRYAGEFVPLEFIELFINPPLTFEVTPLGGGDPLTLTWVGVFDTGSMLTDYNIYLPIEAARSLAGLGEDWVGAINVKADSVDNVDGVSTAIREMYDDSGYPVRTVAAKDMMTAATEAMSTVQKFLLAIAIGAAAAGALSIFIVMFTSVTERRREFGVLKAAGWSHQNIITSVLIESLTMALLGIVLGFAVGFAATVGIDHYLGEPITIITPKLLGEIAGFGLAIGIISGLYPAIRAARVSPIETMRAV